MNLKVTTSHSTQQSVKCCNLVYVCIQHQIVCGSLEQVLTWTCGVKIPSPECSPQVKSWVLFQSKQHFSFEFQRGFDFLRSFSGSKELFKIGKSPILFLQGFLVKLHNHSQKDTSHDCGFGNQIVFRCILGIFFLNCLESLSIKGVNFWVDNLSQLSHTLEFHKLLIIKLLSNVLDKLLLFSFFIFNSVLDKFSELLVVGGVLGTVKTLQLGSFLLSERLVVEGLFLSVGKDIEKSSCSSLTWNLEVQQFHVGF